MISLWLCFIFWFINLIICSGDLSTLEMLIIIHRHGDRTPIKTFPKDPYNNDLYWPDGWGQLTKQGKERMFKLGKHFRERYANFLTYNPKEVHLRSSDADRCLESAALVMAGLYPPQERWNWSKDLNWQPFPIHTVPKNEDGLLFPMSDCPKAVQERSRIEQSFEYQNYMKKYEKLLSYVSFNTGVNFTNLFQASDVFDSLNIEKNHSLPLPKWVTTAVFNQLEEINHLVFWLYYSTKTIQRLRSGLLMKDIRDHFMTHINHCANSFNKTRHLLVKKLFVYSTHDTQIASFLNLIDSFNMLAPPFGSSIVIELFSTNSKTNYFLKFEYLNETSLNSSYTLHPPCCKTLPCDIRAFFECVEIVKDWKKECIAFNFTMIFKMELFTYALVALFIITVIILILIICSIFYNHAKAPYFYRMLLVT